MRSSPISNEPGQDLPTPRLFITELRRFGR